jgi:hypothetical protein
MSFTIAKPETPDKPATRTGGPSAPLPAAVKTVSDKTIPIISHINTLFLFIPDTSFMLRLTILHAPHIFTVNNKLQNLPWTLYFY